LIDNYDFCSCQHFAVRSIIKKERFKETKFLTLNIKQTMKKLITTIGTVLCCSLAILTVQLQAQTTIPKAQTADVVVNTDVNAPTFKKLIETKPGQVLDVRTPEEWAEGIINGAIKMNYYDKDFSKQLDKLDKTKPVYVYCKVGGRSGSAAKELEKKGFKLVYNLDGGIKAWDKEGYPKVK